MCWGVSVFLVIQYIPAGFWIRIGSGFSDFVDPDPYWKSGSRGKKIEKFQWKKCTFYLFFSKNFTTRKV
jgi:hypothetical protein